MPALNDAERAVAGRKSEDSGEGALPMPITPTQITRSSWYPTWLPSRRFLAAVIAIGGMQLLATMDSTVAIVALPKIQDELNLSDAGRSGSSRPTC